jgi:hypothetical protein
MHSSLSVVKFKELEIECMITLGVTEHRFKYTSACNARNIACYVYADPATAQQEAPAKSSTGHTDSASVIGAGAAVAGLIAIVAAVAGTLYRRRQAAALAAPESGAL